MFLEMCENFVRKSWNGIWRFLEISVICEGDYVLSKTDGGPGPYYVTQIPLIPP
jgi:hypothetical protein